MEAPALKRSSGAAARVWYTAFILGVVNALAVLDRSLPTILLEPIKQEFAVSDTQLGLMSGTAFSICYVIVGLPLAWIADRGDRARLITLAVFFWSAMTAYCGYAPTFEHLFLGRMGVGVGESVLIPCAYALLGDLFPRDLRARALSFFVLGLPVGTALALAAGGFGQVALPMSIIRALGVDEAWRATFIIVGLAGVVVGFLTMWLSEPRRGVAGKWKPSASIPMETKALLTYLRATAGVLVPLVLGMALLNMAIVGYANWAPTLFIRHFHLSPAVVGGALGLAVFVVGIFGIPLGAWMSEELARLRRRDSVILVLIFSSACTVPLAALAPLVPSSEAALALYVGSLVFVMLATALTPAVVINVAPPEFRGRLAAMYSFVVMISGVGAGPAVFGVVTDYVFNDPAKLNQSMSATMAILLLGAIAFLGWTERRYQSAIDRVEGSSSN